MSPELWNRIPPEAQVIFLEMAETIKRLERRVEELERRLNMTPSNSSLPPASQHPHAKPAPPKPKSKRKRGGQRGHQKCERPLIPADQCTDVVPLKPTRCRRCGEELRGDDPQPLRHQVWELPEIKPLVTEYQRHRLTCECCHTSTCASLPAGVPEQQAGPRLVAFTALLMGCFRQSKRRTALFLESILNVPCSVGWVVKLQNRATAALRPAYAQLAAALPEQDVLGIDESPTKEGTRKSWLWTFVAKNFTFFAVRPTRKRLVLDELLTDRFDGVVTCDRAKMYWHLPALQWCWAHLKRDFQALADSSVRAARTLGQKLLEQTRRVFRQWSRCRDGTISRAGLKTSLGAVRRSIAGLLLRGFNGRHARTAEVCRELLWYQHRLWTFLDHADVEPTNNASERALRPAVIWRKLSFGTQSAAGSRFTETMLTVIETCRRKQRDPLSFLINTITAQATGHPTPSLLFGA
jgi:transposase